MKQLPRAAMADPTPVTPANFESNALGCGEYWLLLAEEALGSVPQAVGALRVERVGGHGRDQLLRVHGPLIDRSGFGVVVEVPATDALQQRRDCGEDRRGCTLLNGLLLVHGRGQLADDMPLQPSGDRAGASFLLTAGTHTKVVQEHSGHSSYAITADIYSHVAPAQRREAADRLDEALER
jgi:hypothetical protein